MTEENDTEDDTLEVHSQATAVACALGFFDIAKTATRDAFTGSGNDALIMALGAARAGCEKLEQVLGLDESGEEEGGGEEVEEDSSGVGS